MKVALIVVGNIWYAPYVRIYTKMLDEQKVDYSIISWNRDGRDKPEGFQYDEKLAVVNGSAGLSAYMRYVRFVKKTVKREGFDRLIVFGPQIACLLSLYLLKWKRRYIIDYRDLSIEQKRGFKQLFRFLLGRSYANVISSPGFKKALPKDIQYYLSHNFDIAAVRKALESESETSRLGTGKKVVLTIGGIRDYSSNVEVIKGLANKPGYVVSFVGRGPAAEHLEKFCKENGIENVTFKGYYEKPEEAGYVKEASFMNIFYPRKLSHDTALSNRFYNSLIFRKPMIVTKDTTQGDYAEKYGVGVALENTEGLAEKLDAFLQQDFVKYSQRCNTLLGEFIHDYEEFENVIKQFVSA